MLSEPYRDGKPPHDEAQARVSAGDEAVSLLPPPLGPAKRRRSWFCRAKHLTCGRFESRLSSGCGGGRVPVGSAVFKIVEGR